jgi:hypothetical protein
MEWSWRKRDSGVDSTGLTFWRRELSLRDSEKCLDKTAS